MQNGQANAKKGKKLFGIFNVIDIIFIVIVVLAVVIFVWKRGSTKVETKTYVIGFYADEVSDFVIENVHYGDTVVGDSDFDYLGEIIDIDIFESASYGTDDQGKIVRSGKEGYKSAAIYCQVNAQSNGYGLYINGHTYAPGHSFTYYSNNAKMYLRVLSLQEVTEYKDGSPVFEKPDIITPLEKMDNAVLPETAGQSGQTEDVSAGEKTSGN